MEILEDRRVPANLTVTNVGDNGGVDPAPNAGTGTLRQAIVDANASIDASSTITFIAAIAPGTIQLSQPLDSLVKNITIVCAPAGGITVKATLAFGVFRISTRPTCEIDGLKIQEPTREGDYGITNEGGTLTLKTDTISNCGGGVRNKNGGTITMSSCTVTSNTAALGGGILDNSGTVTCNNCTITNNNAQSDGGGIYIDTGALVILNQCSVSYNSAAQNGGGIYNNGSISVTGSNSPGGGGGIGGPSLSTDLMWNVAGGAGGGLYQTGSSATADFSYATIAYNVATGGSGGGCYLDAGFAQFTNYCLISGNQAAGPGNGIAYTASAGLFIDPTCTVNDSVVLV